MSIDDDYADASKFQWDFMRKAKQYIRGVDTVMVARPEDDLLKATDLIILTKKTDLIILKTIGPRRYMVACRGRRWGKCRHPDAPYEFTIRSKRDNGTATELDKIKDGFGDFLMYGHETGPKTGEIGLFHIIDLNLFRASPELRKNTRDIPNFDRNGRPDGTYFRSYDMRHFKPTIAYYSPIRELDPGPAQAETFTEMIARIRAPGPRQRALFDFR